MYELTTDEFRNMWRDSEGLVDRAGYMEMNMILFDYVYEYPRDKYNRLHDGGLHTITEVDDAVHEMIAHDTNVVRLV